MLATLITITAMSTIVLVTNNCMLEAIYQGALGAPKSALLNEDMKKSLKPLKIL